MCESHLSASHIQSTFINFPTRNAIINYCWTPFSHETKQKSLSNGSSGGWEARLCPTVDIGDAPPSQTDHWKPNSGPVRELGGQGSALSFVFDTALLLNQAPVLGQHLHTGQRR